MSQNAISSRDLKRSEGEAVEMNCEVCGGEGAGRDGLNLLYLGEGNMRENQ